MRSDAAVLVAEARLNRLNHTDYQSLRFYSSVDQQCRCADGDGNFTEKKPLPILFFAQWFSSSGGDQGSRTLLLPILVDKVSLNHTMFRGPLYLHFTVTLIPFMS